MDEKAQVHVQVNSSTKEEWEQAAAEHPAVPNESLSQLIRLAVARELDDDQDTGQATGGEIAVDLSSIEEQQASTEKSLVELRNVVDRMDTRLNEVQRDVSASVEKQSLRDRLFHALPPARPHSEPWARAKPTPIPKDRRKLEVAWSGRLDEITVVARDAPSIIQDQLDEMPVDSAEIDDTVRYWLREG